MRRKESLDGRERAAGVCRECMFSFLQALVSWEPCLQPDVTSSGAPRHQPQLGQEPLGRVRPLPVYPPGSPLSECYSPNSLRATSRRHGSGLVLLGC